VADKVRKNNEFPNWKTSQVTRLNQASGQET
jgi:hypothetical protein